MKHARLLRSAVAQLGIVTLTTLALSTHALAQENRTPADQQDDSQLQDAARDPLANDTNGSSVRPDHAHEFSETEKLEHLRTRLARLREAERRVLAAIEQIEQTSSSPSSPTDSGPPAPDAAQGQQQTGRDVRPVRPSHPDDIERGPHAEIKLTREQKIELLERMIRHTRPTLWEDLQALHEKDPEAYEQRMDKLLRWGSRLIDEHQRDPIRFEYRMQELRIGKDAFRVAREIVLLETDEPADAASLADKRAELISLMEQQSRIQTQLREHEIARARELARQAQARVRSLERDLVQFAADHAMRVERNTDELLRRVRAHMDRQRHAEESQSQDRLGPRRQSHQD